MTSSTASNSPNCNENCAPAATKRNRHDGFGYPNLEARNNGHWAFRQYGTEWYKQHCETCSNPYSRTTLQKPATGFGPDEDASKPWLASKAYWGQATFGVWTPTSRATSTPFHKTD